MAQDKNMLIGGLILGVWFVGGVAWNAYKDSKAEADAALKAEALKASVTSRLDAVDKSTENLEQQDKEIIDIAFSDWGALDIVNARYPDRQVRQRVVDFIASGGQAKQPLDEQVFKRLADIDCTSALRETISKADYTRDDIISSWRVARWAQEQTWLPHMKNPRETAESCEHRFALVLKKLDKSKPLTVRGVGETMGKAASDVGNWWNSTTKPISDAVDDFKAGYNSAEQ